VGSRDGEQAANLRLIAVSVAVECTRLPSMNGRRRSPNVKGGTSEALADTEPSTREPLPATSFAIPAVRVRSDSPLQIGSVRLRYVLIGVLAAIPVVLPFDAASSDWFRQLAPPGTDLRAVLHANVEVFGVWTFVGVGVVVLLGGLYGRRGRGLPIKPDRLLGGYLAALTLCLSSLHLVKFLLGRARPKLPFGPYYLEPFGNPFLGFDSFPSGHTTAAFVLALLLNIYFPRAAWPVYLSALLVGVQRMVLGRHFPTDVLGGMALAMAGVMLCRRWLGPSCYHPLWSPPEQAAHPQPAAAGAEHVREDQGIGDGL
jgi:membrane-associated phospholipid phosphatase